MKTLFHTYGPGCGIATGKTYARVWVEREGEPFTVDVGRSMHRPNFFIFSSGSDKHPHGPDGSVRLNTDDINQAIETAVQYCLAAPFGERKDFDF